MRTQMYYFVALIWYWFGFCRVCKDPDLLRKIELVEKSEHVSWMKMRKRERERDPRVKVNEREKAEETETVRKKTKVGCRERRKGW